MLPGAAAWADARLQREAALSPPATSHVESHRTDQCPRAHAPDCAVCRHLSSPVGLVHGHLATPEFSVETPIVAVGSHSPSALPFSLPLALAPPPLS
jgi:hypothetical protein